MRNTLCLLLRNFLVFVGHSSPFIIYFFSVLIFACIYDCFWKTESDSFIVNSELNLFPISESEEIIEKNEETIETQPITLVLSKLQIKWRELVSENNELKGVEKKLFNQIKSLEEEKNLIVSQIQDERDENFKTYMNDELSEILEREKQIKKVISYLEFYLDEIKENLVKSSSLEVDIAKKRVELAKINQEKIAKELELTSRLLSDPSFLDDDSLKKKLEENNKKLSNLKTEQSDLERKYINFEKKVLEFNKSYHEERRKILNFEDFLFYSFGIATTTTFGDIIANSKEVRRIVSIQLLGSVVIVAWCLKKITD